MRLEELENLTRIYCRDNNAYMFQSANIRIFLNQAIDRLKQYPAFRKMKHLKSGNDVPNILPEEYHYLLALFASSRLFDTDERFFEGTEKRNEFEHYLTELISNIQSGNLQLVDEDDEPIVDTYNPIDFVTDVYFTSTILDEGELVD